MAAHKLKISSPRMRSLAWAWIAKAPEGSIISIQTEPKRTDEQNAKLWPMLADISKQVMHNGKWRSKESWKLLIMHALKYETSFEMGLNGEPFPTGFSSKELGKDQFSDMIEFMYKFGAENDVKWSERGYT